MMHRYQKGDAVWVYWEHKDTGYPQMYHRPGVITKKVHPSSFMVAFVANDPKASRTKWTLDRRSHEHHPSDLHPYNLDPGAELRRKREVWTQETPPEKQAAWRKEETERKKANEEINRRLRPIMARMLGG